MVPSSELGSWWRSASYWLLILPVGAMAAGAMLTQAPLSWDGSYYLFAIYDRSAPFVPLDRYEVLLQQWPAVLAARTGSYPLTHAAFVVAYAATPLVLFGIALALVWRTRRAHVPILVLGMLVSTLVSQSFLVAESVIAVQIWWCAWAAFAPATRTRRRNVAGCVFVLLAVFTYLPAMLLVPPLALALWFRERSSALPWVDAMGAVLLLRGILIAVNGGIPATERANAEGSMRDLGGPIGTMFIVGFGLVLLALTLYQLGRIPGAPGAVMAGAGLAAMLLAVVENHYLGLQQRTSLWLLAVPVGLVGCVALATSIKPVRLGVAAPALLGVSGDRHGDRPQLVGQLLRGLPS